MTTTGKTPTSNIQAMITGWEEIDEEHQEHNDENEKKSEKK
jgi:hypothetical protein